MTLHFMRHALETLLYLIMAKKTIPERVALSKSLRFKIFQRDLFTCNYCGSKPPMVVLEVDHIIPVVKGGDNMEENLITSCFDCNRGKSTKSLTQIPESKSLNLELLKEKELQLKEYNKIVEKIRKRINSEIEDVADLFTELFDYKYSLSENFKKVSVKWFIEKIGKYETLDAIRIAHSRNFDADRTVLYFCGICRNKIKKQNEG